MKQFMLGLSVLLIAGQLSAQTNTTTNITPRNSWLKAGITAGVPVGDLADYSSFVLGADLKGQVMETRNFGFGITTGYNHYFGKDKFDDFGSIPLGIFGRYYPQSNGFFAGTDLGYSFITEKGATGGLYVKPQIGYHNYDWNFFGYYNHVFRGNEDGGSLGNAGIGATYNIRFNKK